MTNKKNQLNLKRGVIFLSLLILLSSCGTSRVQPVNIAPPAVRLQGTNFTCRANTNGELWECYQDALEAIEACNMDKKAIRDFYGKK